MKKIQLTQGKAALVDDEDFEFLSQWSWCYNGKYAVKMTRLSDGSRATIYMHRLIAPPPKGREVDHIDGDKLNNKRGNLRACTTAENQRNRPAPRHNTSGYKGVYWDVSKSKWRAQIKVGGKNAHIRYSANKEEAALIYNEAALKYHGEFAYQNEVKV